MLEHACDSEMAQNSINNSKRNRIRGKNDSSFKPSQDFRA